MEKFRKAQRETRTTFIVKEGLPGKENCHQKCFTANILRIYTKTLLQNNFEQLLLRNRDREFDRELPANIKQNKAVVQCCFKLSFYWSVRSLKQVKGSFHCLKNRNKYQNFQQIHYETNSLIHYDTLLHG